jgi:hypothetical protein
MTFDEWITQIRDVAHTGDEIATLHFARALRYAPQTQELHARWQDVRAYAACLDLDAVAPVMAGHGWRLNKADGGQPSRTVTSPDGQTFRLSPARYLAAWADEMPRPAAFSWSIDGHDHVDTAADWWRSADMGFVYPQEDEAYSAIWNFHWHKTYVTQDMADAHVEAVRARIQHRALVQYLRARLWMDL